MSVIGKSQVKIAASKRTKMSFDAQHITTSNFMELQPVYYRHMLVGEKISVDVNSLSRLAPLSVPTFGRANLNLRAFFVPYRTVCPYFNEFMADTLFSSASTSAIPQSVPFFKGYTLWKYFINVSNLLMSSFAVQPSVYDFYDGAKWYTLTQKGKRVYKIFCSLGYKLIPYDKQPNTDITFNALALLSFARIYFDWYSVPQYRNSSNILSLQKLFSKNDPSTAYELLTSDFLALGGLFATSSYNQDYFTSAWDNPVSPSTSNFTPLGMADVTDPAYPSSSNVVTQSSSNGTPFLTSLVTSNPDMVNISEYSLHLLHVLNNYAVRHSMSGARAIDRLLVDFGVQLRSERLNRSTYIGSDVEPLQIGDVTQTSNTAAVGSTSNLGDYGGRGLIRGQKTFEYEADEFGMLIICSSIVPNISYVQGFDRHNLHLSKTDFYNPSWDALGVQAIAKGELYVSPNRSFFAVTDDDDVLKYKDTFGFSPTYAEYKIGRDWLSGDFAVDSANAGRTSWFLSRLFDDNSFVANGDIDDTYHSLDFCRAVDSDQYNRIFNDTSSTYDSFYLFFNFNVNSYLPAKPLYDTYCFEGEEDNASVTIDTNGTKLT